ncbi:hypothetical protein ARMSODRAFT_368817 [Armillaria solidipes]|uniref:Uncharacterized protein n=1 Tax=Armillaria solidipes TaxID=1076256 RepID=A0A2H3B5B4_9AGAR|nr:hypothetical protein ARMSODRAFT_368817 [Armillaria solidipes]
MRDTPFLLSFSSYACRSLHFFPSFARSLIIHVNHHSHISHLLPTFADRHSGRNDGGASLRLTPSSTLKASIVHSPRLPYFPPRPAEVNQFGNQHVYTAFFVCSVLSAVNADFSSLRRVFRLIYS